MTRAQLQDLVNVAAIHGSVWTPACCRACHGQFMACGERLYEIVYGCEGHGVATDDGWPSWDARTWSVLIRFESHRCQDLPAPVVKDARPGVSRVTWQVPGVEVG